LNAIAYGFPYPNVNMNQITPNGLFVWKNTKVDALSSYSKLNIDNLCNQTNFDNLYDCGASSLLSSLNVVGIINGSGTTLTNLN
jgi:hypothetical protein